MNNRLVTSLLDRLTPFVKKEVAKADKPDKIRFKPSDLPDLPELKRVMTEPTEVAPFAERLIHPELFGMNPAINKTKAIVKTTEKLISETKDEGVKQTFSKLYQRILVNSTNIDTLSDGITTIMQKIDMIDNPKIKKDILSSIDVLNGMSKKSFKNCFEGTMGFVEDYADAVNTLNGKYLNRNNKTRSFYNWMDKKNIWLLDIIDQTKKTEDKYRKNLLSTNKRNKKYEEYLRNYDTLDKKGLSKTYETNLKLDAFRSFFDVYSPTRKEAVKTLYYDEYLKTLSPEIAEECTKIQKEYGTYVITSNADIKVDDIKYIKEELDLWKAAGAKEFKAPKIIDVNCIDEYLLKTTSSGSANILEDTIKVRELLQDDGNCKHTGATLRHEIQHLHDSEILKPKNSFDELGDNIVWKYNKFRHAQEWGEELENAGLSEGVINYGLSKRDELLSVTAEADFEKLSWGYENKLVKTFKMKPWIFRLGKNKTREASKQRTLAEQTATEIAEKSAKESKGN